MVVYVELAEIPKVVGYKIAHAEKLKAKALAGKVKPSKQDKKPEEEDKDKDGVNDKLEEKESGKAVAEKAAKVEKTAVNIQKHTAQGKHSKNVTPVRKVLK